MRKLLRMLVAYLLVPVSLLYAQQTTVSGVVTSVVDHTPLPGISVTVKETERGTQTNANGRFTLAVSKGEILEFSGVGFTTQSVTVGDNSIINLQVSTSNKQLGEVVVTAYGMTKAKRELAYKAKKTNSEFNFLLQKVKCLL